MKAIMGNDKVGYKPWVENKDWWKDHEQDMDTSNMSKKELKEYEQMQKRIKRKKRHCMKFPNEPACQGYMHQIGGEGATDLGSIREKLANHYDHEATGDAKEHFPTPMDAVDNAEGDFNLRLQELGLEPLTLEEINAAKLAVST